MGLSVLDTSTDGATATVDFVAKYKSAGRLMSLAEHSRFVLENDRWFYVDGDLG
jgi:SEC-C motif-containing protein